MNNEKLATMTYSELLDYIDAVQGELKRRRRVYANGRGVLDRDVRSWPTGTLIDEITRLCTDIWEYSHADDEIRLVALAAAKPLYRAVAAEWVRRHLTADADLTEEQREEVRDGRLPASVVVERNQLGDGCPRCLRGAGFYRLERPDRLDHGYKACADCYTRWPFGTGWGGATTGPDGEPVEQFLDACDEVDPLPCFLMDVDGEAVRAALEDGAGSLPF